MTADSSIDPRAVLSDLWRLADLLRGAPGVPSNAVLTGHDGQIPSSFAVGTAAQTTIAAAALAACELGHLRGQARQTVSVEMAHAALECACWFSLDGKVPAAWDQFSGLYQCADGWVRIHTNFAHHRDGALRLMGLNPETATRAQAEAAMLTQHALAFEQAAADAGLVVAAMRTFEEWDRHDQGKAIAAQPLMTFERIGEAPARAWLPLVPGHRPLTGLRVLDLTRILAGPVCGRTLAANGADVMLVNSPHLPNIDAIAETSRGKLSCHIDLHTDAGRATLKRLAKDCQVFVQGYRPGGLAALDFDAAALAQIHPGIVYVSLSAYGEQGPWGQRRGFDSLVQTAMGFNDAEARALGSASPRALPMQILDYATGHLMAFATCVALLRQQQEGGSWHVRLSLAQTGHWLRSLGRVTPAAGVKMPDRAPYLETTSTGFGELTAIRHSAMLSDTPAQWVRPSMPPGTHPPVWPERA